MDVLGPANVLAVTAASATYASEEIDEATRLAEWLGASHERLQSTELEDEGFLLNPPERCYYCKANLYGDLVALASARGFRTVIDGSHAEDALDFRPGLRALDERGVLAAQGCRLHESGHPRALATAGASDRGQARQRLPRVALPVWEAITSENLGRVGRAERVLREAGFEIVRIRHHGDVARIEVPPADLARLLDAAPVVVPRIKALGYVWVACDLEGYRSGSMNEAL